MSDASELHSILEESQRLGFLGDRPVGDVIEHARGFVRALDVAVQTVLDLGAGGGVPGLVIAHDRPDLHVTLLDRRTKRTDFLERSIRRMGWTDRVTVVAADAAVFARDHAGSIDAVVARGFGPPEVTLRLAARCVRAGGVVIISEPPEGDRWDPAWLDAHQLTRRSPRTDHLGVAIFVKSR